MKITLGITGSISAYKAIYILREFKKRGEDVYCVLTPEAEYFISPLTLSVLSGHKIFDNPFVKREDAVHINLANNDLILIAPATYNIIGKVAGGIADDLLTSIVAATTSPVVIAPAMNPHMWHNPIIQENIQKLIKLGYFIIEPEKGETACGDEGKGRLPEPDKIVDYVYNLMAKSSSLRGVKILVTTGRTEENIDPIRVITNRSSGLMGYEIAREAKRRGASVTLVRGATDFSLSEGIRIHNTRELEERVLSFLNANDIVIMAAAVADFKPRKASNSKIKRTQNKFDLRLEATDDILMKLRKKGKDKILVGFCVESKALIENAKRKLFEKSLDMIVANPSSVIGSKNTTFAIIEKNSNVTRYRSVSKRKAAGIILDEVTSLWEEKRGKREGRRRMG